MLPPGIEPMSLPFWLHLRTTRSLWLVFKSPDFKHLLASFSFRLYQGAIDINSLASD